jgi:hypothetical protein
MKLGFLGSADPGETAQGPAGAECNEVSMPVPPGAAHPGGLKTQRIWGAGRPGRIQALG